jgi:Ca-activated chloride channel family protein
VTIDHPLRLGLGVVVLIVFAVLYGMLQRRATTQDLAYSNIAFFADAAKPRTWIPRALQMLWLVAFAALVLGVGGPHLQLMLPAHDGSVFICIDTSGSMAATDVFPTRAEASKAAARAFIGESPSGTKIGIISFAGAAGVVVPLSADHQAILSGLDEIPPPLQSAMHSRSPRECCLAAAIAPSFSLPTASTIAGATRWKLRKS